MKVDTKEIASVLGIAETHIPLLVGAFLDESKEIVEKLLAAVSSSNYADMTLHAHSIKGSSANLRLTEISDCAMGLEKAANSQDASYNYADESQKLKILVEAVEL